MSGKGENGDEEVGAPPDHHTEDPTITGNGSEPGSVGSSMAKNGAGDGGGGGRPETQLSTAEDTTDKSHTGSSWQVKVDVDQDKENENAALLKVKLCLVGDGKYKIGKIGSRDEIMVKGDGCVSEAEGEKVAEDSEMRVSGGGGGGGAQETTGATNKDIIDILSIAVRDFCKVDEVADSGERDELNNLKGSNRSHQLQEARSHPAVLPLQTSPQQEPAPQLESLPELEPSSQPSVKCKSQRGTNSSQHKSQCTSQEGSLHEKSRVEQSSLTHEPPTKREVSHGPQVFESPRKRQKSLSPVFLTTQTTIKSQTPTLEAAVQGLPLGSSPETCDQRTRKSPYNLSSIVRHRQSLSPVGTTLSKLPVGRAKSHSPAKTQSQSPTVAIAPESQFKVPQIPPPARSSIDRACKRRSVLHPLRWPQRTPERTGGHEPYQPPSPSVPLLRSPTLYQPYVAKDPPAAEHQIFPIKEQKQPLAAEPRPPTTLYNPPSSLQQPPSVHYGPLPVLQAGLHTPPVTSQVPVMDKTPPRSEESGSSSYNQPLSSEPPPLTPPQDHTSFPTKFYLGDSMSGHSRCQSLKLPSKWRVLSSYPQPSQVSASGQGRDKVSQPPAPVSQPPAPVSQPPAPVSQPPAPVSQPPAPVSQPPAPVSQPQACSEVPRPLSPKVDVPDHPKSGDQKCSLKILPKKPELEKTGVPWDTLSMIEGPAHLFVHLALQVELDKRKAKQNSGGTCERPGGGSSSGRAGAGRSSGRAGAGRSSGRAGAGRSSGRAGAGRSSGRAGAGRSSGRAGAGRSSGRAGAGRSSGRAGAGRSSGRAGAGRSSGRAGAGRSSGRAGAGRSSGRAGGPEQDQEMEAVAVLNKRATAGYETEGLEERLMCFSVSNSTTVSNFREPNLGTTPGQGTICIPDCNEQQHPNLATQNEMGNRAISDFQRALLTIKAFDLLLSANQVELKNSIQQSTLASAGPSTEDEVRAILQSRASAISLEQVRLASYEGNTARSQSLSASCEAIGPQYRALPESFEGEISEPLDLSKSFEGETSGPLDLSKSFEGEEAGPLDLSSNDRERNRGENNSQSAETVPHTRALSESCEEMGPPARTSSSFLERLEYPLQTRAQSHEEISDGEPLASQHETRRLQPQASASNEEGDGAEAWQRRVLGVECPKCDAFFPHGQDMEFVNHLRAHFHLTPR